MNGDGVLYGRSLAFPPRVGANGQMLWSEGERNVRESVCIILRTLPGERIERRDFGAGLDRHLYEPNTSGTLRRIQEEVRRALGRWEPRVILDDVSTALNPADPRAVDVTVAYTLVATQRQERADVTLALQG